MIDHGFLYERKSAYKGVVFDKFIHDMTLEKPRLFMTIIHSSEFTTNILKKINRFKIVKKTTTRCQNNIFNKSIKID